MMIQVRLEREKVAEHAWIYHLVVSGEVEKRFYLARIKDGSMTLVQHEIRAGENGRRILAALFYVNVLGHDLDQWIYFDLESGEQICEAQGLPTAVKVPQRFTIWQQKRPQAETLRRAVARWGRERDASG